MAKRKRWLVSGTYYETGDYFIVGIFTKREYALKAIAWYPAKNQIKLIKGAFKDMEDMWELRLPNNNEDEPDARIGITEIYLDSLYEDYNL